MKRVISKLESLIESRQEEQSGALDEGLKIPRGKVSADRVKYILNDVKVSAKRNQTVPFGSRTDSWWQIFLGLYQDLHAQGEVKLAKIVKDALGTLTDKSNGTFARGKVSLEPAIVPLTKVYKALSQKSEEAPRVTGDKLEEARGNLLTAKDKKNLPELYSQDGVKDPKVWVKFFNPYGSGTWFATEFDGKDTFFGYTFMYGDGELGYFSLREMASNGIERDKYFKPMSLSQAKAKQRKLHGMKEETDEMDEARVTRPKEVSISVSDSQKVKKALGKKYPEFAKVMKSPEGTGQAPGRLTFVQDADGDMIRFRHMATTDNSVRALTGVYRSVFKVPSGDVWARQEGSWIEVVVVFPKGTFDKILPGWDK